MATFGVRLILSVVLLLILFVTLVAAAFSETPVTHEVAVGSEAVFRCQHLSADNVEWTVNGTLIRRRNPPPDITPGTTRDEEDNLVDLLTIVARPQYDRTTVVCVAEFDDETPDERSPSVVLLVQEQTTTMAPTMTPPPPQVSEHPSSLNVTVGEGVQFQCVFPSSSVKWTINGTMLSDEHFPTGVSITFSLGGNGSFLHSLTIEATIHYDNTAFSCVMTASGRSEDAVLRVQGPLDAPSNLISSRYYTTNTTTITWTPPPSIDLTNIEPDIVYCIEVENITCGERGDVIASECGITEPIYQSRDIPLNYIYNITVTPMSNVEGALNGTPAYTEEEFPKLNERSSVSTRPDGTVSATVTMDIADHGNQPLPTFCSLSLRSFGSTFFTVNPALTYTTITTIVLDVNDLQKQMLLNNRILAYTCDHNLLTDESVLSTHYAQHILVSSPAPGEILVTGDFLNSSTTTGLLVIAYTSSSNVRYHLYSRTPNEQNFRTVINNLEAGDYHVSVFTVENGLPFRQVATLPQRAYVPSMENTEIQTTIDYELESTSTGVCITCTFLESSTATDCVAVVHQRISQLNSSAGLMNIESSRKFTRSGDTASGCIEGFNLEDYQVGVIGGRLVNSTSYSSVCTGCVSVSVLAVILFGGSVTVVIAIAYYVCWKDQQKKSTLHNKVNGVMSEESGLDNTNHYGSIHPQDEKITTMSTRELRIHADSSGSGVSQLQPESLTTILEETSFNTPPVTLPKADDDVGQTAALPESAYAEPALVLKPSVSIPPVTERSTYSNVENFKNPLGLTYAMIEHVSQRQHNPQRDDRFTTNSKYSVVVIKKEECTKTKESKGNKEKVAPQSVPPPTPCDIESLGKLLYPISYKWEKFAKALPLDDDHIDTVNTGNETDEACLREVLERYFDNGDFKHTWEEIVTTLRGVDEQLADKIHDLHIYPYKSPLPGQAEDTEDSSTTVDSPNDTKHKNEVIDSSHFEDGDSVALSGDVKGFDDTEKEQPPERDTVTPVLEGVSDPDHQIGQ